MHPRQPLRIAQDVFGGARLIARCDREQWTRPKPIPAVIPQCQIDVPELVQQVEKRPHLLHALIAARHHLVGLLIQLRHAVIGKAFNRHAPFS